MNLKEIKRLATLSKGGCLCSMRSRETCAVCDASSELRNHIDSVVNTLFQDYEKYLIGQGVDKNSAYKASRILHPMIHGFVMQYFKYDKHEGYDHINTAVECSRQNFTYNGLITSC